MKTMKNWFKNLKKEYQNAYLLSEEDTEFIKLNQKYTMFSVFIYSFADGLKYLIAIGGFYLFFNSFFFEIIKELPSVCSIIQ